jgi:hypothetical protein
MQQHQIKQFTFFDGTLNIPERSYISGGCFSKHFNKRDRQYNRNCSMAFSFN